MGWGGLEWVGMGWSGWSELEWVVVRILILRSGEERMLPFLNKATFSFQICRKD